MSKGGGGVSGYRYYFDLLMGLCRGPVDQLVSIRVGDIEAWPAVSDNSATNEDIVNGLLAMFNPGAAAPVGGLADVSGAELVDTADFGIATPNLFGGDKGEGGIVGNATLMMGGRDQVVPDRIKSTIAGGGAGNFNYSYSPSGGVGTDADSGATVEQKSDISDFRGVATLYYSGQVCSNNPYPKTWKLRLRRAVKGWDRNGVWYPAKARIAFQAGAIVGMNPAHILYQCITDRSWGRGLPRSEMDEANWTYAANRLWDEGFGMCIKWSKDTDIDSFVQTVVDHIGAAIYTDRGTGKLTIRLIRNDYDQSLLPFFDYRSGLLRVESIETGGPETLANEVIVKYHDPITDKDRQARVQNLASIQSLGATISQTKSYPGIPDPDLARRVGLRELTLVTAGLKHLRLQMDRRAWKLQPGSVFRISAPDKGIVNMVMRVAAYDDGTLTDGTIKLDCLQDVFGMPSTVFTQEAPPTWTGPQSTVPPPVPNQVAYEASYYDMVRGLTSTQASAITPDEGGIIVVAGRPTANTLSNVVAISPEGGTAALGPTGSFAPTGVLRDNIGYYDTAIYLSGGTELSRIATGGSALIGDEMVRVDAVEVTSGLVTIARGCVDTIPRKHAAGTVIYFHDATLSAHTETYAVGETVGVQLLSRTTTAVQNPSQATTTNVTITGRWAKPYPMGNVRINTVRALQDAPFEVTGSVAFTWASRNKLLEADQLVEHGAGPVVAEADTTYTVEVRNRADGSLIRSHTTTDSSYTYTDAEASDGGDPSELLFVLFTSVAGLPSMDSYSIPVTHLGVGGYGNVYGYVYGELTA